MLYSSLRYFRTRFSYGNFSKTPAILLLGQCQRHLEDIACEILPLHIGILLLTRQPPDSIEICVQALQPRLEHLQTCLRHLPQAGLRLWYIRLE